MGSGNLNMDYPYDNNPNHYNFWKPGNGYFPRGEAPPPYEEAVALAQAEAMNAQCTVRLVQLIYCFCYKNNINKNKLQCGYNDTSITSPKHLSDGDTMRYATKYYHEHN